MRRLSVTALLASLALPGLALAQAAPPAPPPPYAQPEPDVPPPPGAPGRHHHGPGEMLHRLQADFTAANTTHDGHLTLPQAQAANLKPVVDHFAEIDTKNRGYITFNDILAWHMDREAQKLEQRAAQLRARD
jgi:hypothetical protein